MKKKNVHSGDMLIVAPVHEGWCLRWYMVRDQEGQSDTVDDSLACPLSVEPYADCDDDCDDDDEQNNSDERDNNAARAALRNLASTCVSEEQPDEVEAEERQSYFYWETRAAADEACEVAMDAVAVGRATARVAKWAQEALAAGWTPPADWDDRG